MSLLSAARVRVEIRSALLPPLVLGGEGAAGDARGASGSEGDGAGGSAPAASASPGKLAAALGMKLARPMVTVTAGGVEVSRWAPAGEPGEVPWVGPAIVALVVGGLLAAGFGLGRLRLG